MEYEIEENDDYTPPKFQVVDEYGECMENEEGENLFDTKDEALSLINNLEMNAKEIEVDFLLSDLSVNFKFTVHINELGIDRSNSKEEIEKAIYSFFRQTPIDIEEYKFV
jgi:hypothetical protein